MVTEIYDIITSDAVYQKLSIYGFKFNLMILRSINT